MDNGEKLTLLNYLQVFLYFNLSQNFCLSAKSIRITDKEMKSMGAGILI